MPSGSLSTKDYAPLADEINPPFGNIAPAPISRNGTIVYSKRMSHTGSNGSSDDGNHRMPSYGRSDSDDTLTGRRRDRKGKGRAQPIEEDDGDIGSRFSHHHQSSSSNPWEGGGGYVPAKFDDDGGDSASYPPLNETESEEKRIQANLAKFAARDQARRKAARLSKTLPGSPNGSRPNSITSSSGSSQSHARSPISPLSSIPESKRTSILGYLGSRGSSKEKLADTSEVPLSPVSAQTQGYSNPYDSQPSGSSVARLSSSSSAPSMNGSSPFADPSNLTPSTRAASSGYDSTPVDSPVTDGFGYVGPGWRGGAAQTGAVTPPRPERWWHSLCAWGADLDGGDSKQAGRTNPME